MKSHLRGKAFIQPMEVTVKRTGFLLSRHANDSIFPVMNLRMILLIDVAESTESKVKQNHCNLKPTDSMFRCNKKKVPYSSCRIPKLLV
jgi:hypothetical protein